MVDRRRDFARALCDFREVDWQVVRELLRDPILSGMRTFRDVVHKIVLRQASISAVRIRKARRPSTFLNSPT